MKKHPSCSGHKTSANLKGGKKKKGDRKKKNSFQVLRFEINQNIPLLTGEGEVMVFTEGLCF